MPFTRILLGSTVFLATLLLFARMGGGPFESPIYAAILALFVATQRPAAPRCAMLRRPNTCDLPKGHDGRHHTNGIGFWD